MPMNVYMYDLRIDNAHVYDPMRGIDKMASIGIVYPNIAEVFEPAEMAEKKIRICAHNVLDAKGKYVVPGLIDYHSHIFPGMGFAVYEKDLYQHGVTATVDQGSATHTSFPEDRRRFVDTAKMVVNATLMISSSGWLQQDIFSVPCKELINLEKLTNEHIFIDLLHGLITSCKIFLFIYKPGSRRLPVKGNSSNGAVTLFCDNDLRFTRLFRIRVVVFVPVKEHDDIRVLLDGSGLTEVRKHGTLVGSGLTGTGQLGQSHHRAIQIPGQAL